MSDSARRFRATLLGGRPQPSPFEERTPEQERRHRKQRLAIAFRMFAHFGFDEGAAGYLTVVDPILPGHFWTGPFPLSFRLLRAGDLLLVNPEGQIVDVDGVALKGTWPVSASAVRVHLAITAARPDVVSIAHAHSMHSKAFASLGKALDPVTQDACLFFEDIGVAQDSGNGLANNDDEGIRVARALGSCKAALVSDHGLFSVGGSVEEAAWWFVSADHSCQAELLARSAGNSVLIPAETAAKIRSQAGASIAGWYSAIPIFDWIERVQPECLEDLT